METIHQPTIKMEEEYVLCSDSDPESAYLSTSWNWKQNTENYSLSQTPSPQSLSPAASYKSQFSGCSRPSSLEEIPYSEDMVTYRLLPYPSVCQNDMEEDNGRPNDKRRHHNPNASMNAQRRRKASEREKMRMRAIAEALHTLRRNLPAVYSQGRQPLTKIQTLKCTISYIEELTNLLNTTKGT
ncbi:mesogenin-1 [Anomaloglossus baeobatrachus]|uniref:mesogenin-1 n=1 Tax=Anomaloglossus baeobatrachus TaxID=238106 RepID=UPI003F4FCC2E